MTALIDNKDFSRARRASACPILGVTGKTLNEAIAHLPRGARTWIKTSKFSATHGEILLVPGEKGNRRAVLLGLGRDGTKTPDRFVVGDLPGRLPDGFYRLDPSVPEPRLSTLAWELGAYRFEQYKKEPPSRARLIVPDGVDAGEIGRLADGVSLTRDLINSPANDLGPAELLLAARALARTHKAKVRVIAGAALKKRNFPMIHAVGAASTRPPCLIDINWGKAGHARITLVGKGVCFDSGGLNLKPGASMALMKKDMGGAANVLGLASMIMAARLKLRLRVLIPAVDNAVSGNAYRPGDVLQSRKGLTVEIGNTDAEGRLVLADALALADEERPDLLIDMATLTGAARVALGPDLPPFFTDDDALASDLSRYGDEENDPLWRLPLWQPYDGWLDSKIADVNHISQSGLAGAITAALFLKRFVEHTKSYLHIDLFAWTPKPLPGRPEGGEAQGIRALYHLLKDRYGN